MNKSCVTKLISAVLSLFIGTQGAFAAKAESGFWTERNRAVQRRTGSLYAQLPDTIGGALDSLRVTRSVADALPGPVLSKEIASSLPGYFLTSHEKLFQSISPEFGSIRSVVLPKGAVKGVVVHIQDAHGILEAQQNIGRIVDSLSRSGQVGAVGLEGTWEELNLSWFQNFRDPKCVKAAADYQLKVNHITGPVHAAMTHAGPGMVPLIGVDDPVHYPANVDAYRQSFPRMESEKKNWAARSATLKAERERVFNPDLLALDKLVESYHGGETLLTEYIRGLANRGTPGEMARTFLNAADREAKLDFKQVEAERTRLIEKLTAKLSDAEGQALVDQSVAFRLGKIRQGDFYRYLENFCAQRGMPLSQFPALSAYVKYVLVADEIDADRLMAEMATMERDSYARAAKGPEEKSLVQVLRRQWLTGKLLDFAMTREEWDEYGSLQSEKVGEAPPASLNTFENFFREAFARDAHIAKRMDELSSSHGTTVLVTGGFHAQGIAKDLTDMGYAVVAVVPKLETVDTDAGSKYLTLFMQEKTPLDKLVEGKKLFLTMNPETPGNRTEGAAAAVGVAAVTAGNPVHERMGSVAMEAVPATRASATVTVTSPGEESVETQVLMDGREVTSVRSFTGSSFRSRLQGALAIIQSFRAKAMARLSDLMSPSPTVAVSGDQGGVLGRSLPKSLVLALIISVFLFNPDMAMASQLFPVSPDPAGFPYTGLVIMAFFTLVGAGFLGLHSLFFLFVSELFRNFRGRRPSAASHDAIEDLRGRSEPKSYPVQTPATSQDEGKRIEAMMNAAGARDSKLRVQNGGESLNLIWSETNGKLVGEFYTKGVLKETRDLTGSIGSNSSILGIFVNKKAGLIYVVVENEKDRDRFGGEFVSLVVRRSFDDWVRGVPPTIFPGEWEGRSYKSFSESGHRQPTLMVGDSTPRVAGIGQLLKAAGGSVRKLVVGKAFGERLSLEVLKNGNLVVDSHGPFSGGNPFVLSNPGSVLDIYANREDGKIYLVVKDDFEISSLPPFKGLVVQTLSQHLSEGFPKSETAWKGSSNPEVRAVESVWMRVAKVFGVSALLATVVILVGPPLAGLLSQLDLSNLLPSFGASSPMADLSQIPFSLSSTGALGVALVGLGIIRRTRVPELEENISVARKFFSDEATVLTGAHVHSVGFSMGKALAAPGASVEWDIILSATFRTDPVGLDGLDGKGRVNTHFVTVVRKVIEATKDLNNGADMIRIFQQGVLDGMEGRIPMSPTLSEAMTHVLHQAQREVESNNMLRNQVTVAQLKELLRLAGEAKKTVLLDITLGDEKDGERYRSLLSSLTKEEKGSLVVLIKYEDGMKPVNDLLAQELANLKIRVASTVVNNWKMDDNGIDAQVLENAENEFLKNNQFNISKDDFSPVSILGLPIGYVLMNMENLPADSRVAMAIKFYFTLLSAELENDLRTFAALLIQA